ncbi:carboxyltransferase domain-containing protein [Yoonia sp.]|uniref:5-oxoprolinase subunit B family protein n=1 Tax=Yoonia sp. TaxID=2212373 RepID=UPI0019D82CB8|nr:carboxyltransferase domain-containing protein [Yoonia sp.]MBE0412299.1 carboxyltransferase domain-containing protein [Yoonia sp.]
MSAPLPAPELRPLGVDGVLVRFAATLTEAANQRALAFRDQVNAMNLPGVTEVASSLVSVRVGFDPAQTARQTVVDALQTACARLDDAVTAPKRRWDIPVAFGPDHAPQLTEAAALAGVTPEQAVTEIEAQILRVIAIGFAPGQPYLGMLPPHWDIPRQTSLTAQMPNGALVAAVRQLIIFAADAPTGWRHIGQTAFRVYRPDSDTPFPLSPGDAVRFRAVSDSEYVALRQNTDTNGGARCTVLS